MRPGRPVVFLHLFKCGGTTVIERLRARLGNAAVLHVKDVRTLEATLQANPLAVARHAAVVGHLSLPLLETYFADWAWVTVLRDPVDRMLSQYHHFRREAASVMEEDGEASDHAFRLRFCAENDLLAFATSEDPRLTVYTRNYMTRKLAGVLRVRRAPLGGKVRAAAIANLPRFAVVGTTDTLDADFLPSLDRLLGRRSTIVDRLRRPANVSLTRLGHRPRYEAAVLEAILEHNAADVALYAATRWFEPAAAADSALAPEGPMEETR